MEKFKNTIKFTLGFVIILIVYIITFSNYSTKRGNNFDIHNNLDVSNAYSVENKIVYAKVKENCFLFKTSDVNNSSYHNVTYIIPESYFVIILSQINSYIYKVQYRSKIGYVTADSINLVDFIPVQSFLNNITFDIPEGVGTQIRQTPSVDDSSNILAIIPAGAKNISYIANIIGVIPSGGSSNVWYYCSYSPMSDPTSVYEGYVYSEKTENLSNIEYNNEGVVDADISDSGDNEDSIVISPLIKYILISVMCLPIIIIFTLLAINFKRNKKTKEVVNMNTSNKYDDCGDNEIRSKNIEKRSGLLRKIEELEGKTLKSKKANSVSKFISSQKNLIGDFPVYEIVDEDDLL